MRDEQERRSNRIASLCAYVGRRWLFGFVCDEATRKQSQLAAQFLRKSYISFTNCKVDGKLTQERAASWVACPLFLSF